ncbi:hypothetical protein [Halorubrum sp. AS12]|uniref:hypothetical protein n=1 Tax=Halorubrum sp. AS12 TaxID=3409687 RepID=UPI003DA76C82
MVLVSVSEIDTPKFKTIPADITNREAVERILSKNYFLVGLTKVVVYTEPQKHPLV